MYYQYVDEYAVWHEIVAWTVVHKTDIWMVFHLKRQKYCYCYTRHSRVTQILHTSVYTSVLCKLMQRIETLGTSWTWMWFQRSVWKWDFRLAFLRVYRVIHDLTLMHWVWRRFGNFIHFVQINFSLPTKLNTDTIESDICSFFASANRDQPEKSNYFSFFFVMFFSKATRLDTRPSNESCYRVYKKIDVAFLIKLKFTKNNISNKKLKLIEFCNLFHFNSS